MSENRTLPETEAAFEMLKGPASRILSLPSIGPSNAAILARDLGAIASVLGHMPDPEAIMTTQLIAYVHHTLNHVLRLCHLFKTKEKRFDFVVEPWCCCFESLMRLPDGYRLVVESGWRYLRLLFDVLFVIVDGIPVATKDSASSQNKQSATGKKDVMSDDTRLAALRCLILLLPLSSLTAEIDTSPEVDFPDGQIILDGDRMQRTDADSTILHQLLEPINQSLLGQLIVVLLDTAKEAELVALRTTALEGVMKLLRCLESPRRIANWIPGISAGLTKIMLERGLKENHLVQTHSLHIWTYMVVLVLRGWETERSRAMGGAAIVSDSSFGASLMDMYKNKATGSTFAPNPVTDFASDEWLSKLLHGLQTLFAKIGMIRLHPHWKVRLQFADMAFNILKDCQGSIISNDLSSSTSAASFLLETLIGSTQDDFVQVSKPAGASLNLLALQYKSQDLSSASKEILRGRLVALPRILYGPDESLKQSDIKMVQGLALFLGREMEGIVTYQTLWGFVQPWISTLRIEQLDHHNMDERRGILGINSISTDSHSTSEDIRWADWTMKRHGTDRKFGFPRRIHLHLREQATSDAFLAFVRQIGASTDLNLWTDDLMSRLQRDTYSVRENDGWFGVDTASTVLLMNHLLLGAANVGLTSFETLEQSLSTTSESVGKKLKEQAALERKRQRQVRRTARGILEEYLEVLSACSQLSTDAMAREEADRRTRTRFTEEEEENASRKRASKALMLALDEDSIDLVMPESRIYDPKTDVMLRCLLLQGISSVAVVVGGDEFELELIKVLYVLLEHLGDQSSALVRDTAHAALEHVAFVCRSASIGDLIQSNYDYVIQQVSQRIAFLSANPTTPQVLWSLVHVVGMPAVSMLEDSVTEIFEALDSWKSKEDQVGEGLFKSLVEIVKVIAESTHNRVEQPGDEIKSSTFLQLPSAEVAEYARTYRILVNGVDNQEASSLDNLDDEMKKKTSEEIEEYFNKVLLDAKEREESRLGEQEDPEDSQGEDEDMMSFGELRSKMPKPSKEPKQEPMSKHEALSLRILNKAGYFLTAPSPRLQILALEVIQSSIIVLRHRSTELNTSVYAFWPQIVSRALQRSELDMFYVSLRAIEVVTLLAKSCSDFIGRHLLDDIWPFLLKALDAWIRAPELFSRDNRMRPTGHIARLSGPESKADKENRVISGRGSEKQQSHSRQRQGKIFTKEHRLQMTTLKSVSQIVQQVRIPVKEVWTMLLLARDIMMDRPWIFHREVRLAAADVIQSVAKAGHGDSVWLVLTAALEEAQAIDEKDDSIQMCQDILHFMQENGL